MQTLWLRIMLEGFNPTPKGIEIIRDYVTGKI
jgi:hypothetical protein